MIMAQNSPHYFAVRYETERLILKMLTADYAEKVCDFLTRNKEVFGKYEPVTPPNYYTPAYQATMLNCEMQLALKEETIRYYVFLKENPKQIIGTVCLHNITPHIYSCCEIGYKFDAAYWHMGYAREAVAMGVSIAFAALGLHRVLARVMPENTASIRLLKSLLFEEEGLERESIRIQNVWQDHLRFSLVNHSSNT